MIELIGWIGSMCFCFAALPQAIKCMKQGHAHGVSTTMLVLWLIGEIGSLIYVLPKWHVPLIANYVINLVFLGMIFRYRLFPKSKEVI